MTKKRIIAMLLCLIMVLSLFSGCKDEPVGPPVNDDITNVPADELVLPGAPVDVTAITGVTDKDGKVIDNKGLIDNEGHKIFDTGFKNDAGETIYTTGKKDASGNVLYTLNKTDDRGNLLYFTGKEEGGKLVLEKTNAIPDYSSNNNSKLDYNSRYTTTTTVKFDSSTKITPATKLSKGFLTFSQSTKDNQFRKIVPAKDGGLIATGIASSNTGIFSSASSSWTTFGTVAKLKADGSVEWTYVDGGDADIMFNDIAQLSDETIIAVGQTSATNTDAPKQAKVVSSLIVKLDKDGKRLWSYAFPGDQNSDGDYALCVAATPDGGFVVGGMARSSSGFFNGNTKTCKAYIIGFDKDGKVQWRKLLSGSKDNSIKAIAVNSSGDVFASCSSYSTDGSFTSFVGYGKKGNTVIVKLNKDGNLKWNANLVGSGKSEYTALTATADGGCIAGGVMSIDKRADGSYFMSYGKEDGYIVRFSKDGSVFWARNIGGTQFDDVQGVLETEKGIVVIGKTKSKDMDMTEIGNAGGFDSYVMILDSKGSTTFSYPLGGKEDEYVFGLSKAKNGFAVCGFTRSNDGTFAGSKSSKTAQAFVSSYTFG